MVGDVANREIVATNVNRLSAAITCVAECGHPESDAGDRYIALEDVVQEVYIN